MIAANLNTSILRETALWRGVMSILCIVIMVGWLVGVSMQIVAGAIARLRAR